MKKIINHVGGIDDLHVILEEPQGNGPANPSKYCKEKVTHPQDRTSKYIHQPNLKKDHNSHESGNSHLTTDY